MKIVLLATPEFSYFILWFIVYLTDHTFLHPIVLPYRLKLLLSNFIQDSLDETSLVLHFHRTCSDLPSVVSLISSVRPSYDYKYNYNIHKENKGKDIANDKNKLHGRVQELSIS